MKSQIAAQNGIGFHLREGEVLEVFAPAGQQVADLFCFSEARPSDALSSGRSIDYNETIFLSTGHVLYANSGQPLLEIIEDQCGRHDFLVTPCSQQMFQMVSGEAAYHPSCLENLVTAFAPFGRAAELITTTFNIFMNYRVDSSGKLSLETPLNHPGDRIALRALEDLVVGLTACSDPATNGGTCKAIHFRIRSAP